MSKSVYSVVLMDDVVDAVDRLAYEAGTNRSNMINRILAEYVQLATPEQRMQDIFFFHHGCCQRAECASAYAECVGRDALDAQRHPL